jgi:nicotinamide-nucleotide amidase
MSFSAEILDTAERVIDACRARGWRIGTAESCTGGLVAAALTEIAGASDVVVAGLVSYADDVKMALLGVDEKIFEEHGAVSAEVARSMAKGALDAATLDLSVAITGIAGPGGGSDEKPVGLVYFATARRDGKSIVLVQKEVRYGDLGRHEVRMRAALAALRMLERAAVQ